MAVSNIAEIRRAQNRRGLAKPSTKPPLGLHKVPLAPAEVLSPEDATDPEAEVEVNTWNGQVQFQQAMDAELEAGIEVVGAGFEPPNMSETSDALGGVFDFGTLERKKTEHTPALFIRAMGINAVTESTARGNLWHAALHGDLQTVEYLIEVRCIPVNVRNQWGQTALHCAARNGHASVVLALLRNGARTWMREQELGTPLHLAAKLGHVACVELLLGYGASCHPVNGLGLTPMHEALEQGSVAGIRGEGARQCAEMIKSALLQLPRGLRQPKFEDGRVTAALRSYDWDALGAERAARATTHMQELFPDEEVRGD
jgi:hypothetical protein